MRPRWPILLALLAPPSGGEAKKRPPPATTEAALRAVLDAQSDAVAGCAAPMVAPGAAVEVTAKVLVNHKGQVMSCDVTVAGGDGAAAVRACVERVFLAAKFPPGRAALVTVERTWRFRSQLGAARAPAAPGRSHAAFSPAPPAI